MKNYKIKEITTKDEAKRVTEFLISKYAFDKDMLTPGEINEIKENPLKSLGENGVYYWFSENSQGKIIGVCGIKENTHNTGGYVGDFMAVHKEYRNYGLASKFLDSMLGFMASEGARYILINTCDLKAYEPIRFLLEKKGFSYVGHYPDYYFEGEGMVTYYKKFKAE